MLFPTVLLLLHVPRRGRPSYHEPYAESRMYRYENLLTWYIGMKNLNTPEIPLCVNIFRLQTYRLTPDEVVLFDWLVVKQISFKYKEFHYSQARIEVETRIKRSRQEAILKRFQALRFLLVTVRVNEVTHGQVRYYKVDFELLTEEEVLKEIVYPDVQVLRSFVPYMRFHAEEQKKAHKTPDEREFDAYEVDWIYNWMNEMYEQRRIVYNESQQLYKRPGKLREAIQLPRGQIIDRMLARLVGRYGVETIYPVFVYYADDWLACEESSTNIMYHFLSYNGLDDVFTVFEYFLKQYNKAQEE